MIRSAGPDSPSFWRHDRNVVRAFGGGDDVKAPSGGFVPPPYPHDRLAAVVAEAREIFGPDGIVDCSIGTPCDPPSPAVLAALANSGTERGYPASQGSLAYRQAAASWMQRTFGVDVDPTAQLGACVGTKEFVASLAQYLHLRTPERDTVLYPAISYPTYAMGATLAGVRAVPVAIDGTGGMDLGSIDDEDAARALVLWVNSPANPTGALCDLDEAATWGRSRGVPVFSDECYAEFTWAGPPRSILESGTDGVVAVHSLSKRSNLAGVRVGFYAGDADLVSYLVEVRKHAGFMVPGPAQAAAVAAWQEQEPVDVQRARYLERLEFVREVLSGCGVPCELPEGGFYLWVPVPDGRSGGAWELTADLALRGGLLVSPGDLYGPDGAGFVRVAVVQPSDRLRLVADRLSSVSLVP